MTVADEHGGHVDARRVLPGDASGSIGFDGGEVVPRVAAADEDAFSVGDCGGDAFFGGPLGFPEFFSGHGVEARDEIAAGEDHLRFSCGGDDGWGGVVREKGSGVRPDGFTGFPVERCDASPAFVIGIDEDEFAVDDGRDAEALMHHEITNLLLPEDFAVEIEGGGEDGSLVGEVDIEAFSVARDGGGSGAGETMFP